MASPVKVAYAASTSLTITLAGLATSSTLLTGRSSILVDNTSNLYIDYLVGGQITVGTTPTINTQINVWAIGELNDTPTWPDGFDGTDSGKSVTSTGVGYGYLKSVQQLSVDSTTSNRAYPFGPVSLKQLYGGSLPAKFLLFVAHNTGVNLNSTGGNHFISLTGVYASVG